MKIAILTSKPVFNKLYLFGLCVINMLLMHYFFRLNYIECPPFMYNIATNFLMCIFDITLLFMLLFTITWGRLKVSILLTFILSLFWSLSNVYYGRFFHQYIPFSAFGETSALFDSVVFNSMIMAFKWSDLIYVLTTVLFIIGYQRLKLGKPSVKNVFIKCIALLFLVYVGTYMSYIAYHFACPQTRGNWPLFVTRIKSEILNISKKDAVPNFTRYQWGCVLILLSDILDSMEDKELDREQREMIAFYGTKGTMQGINYLKDTKNVVFILLESFLSAPIDFSVDGEEVTPFLNTLKTKPGVYYNGNVVPNITIGESGDGQLIYMSGILPSRSNISVGILHNHSLPALPKLLKEKRNVELTEIIVPTSPVVWRQNDMNAVYGIDDMYSENDIKSEGKITDREVFNMAMHTSKNKRQPFFSMMLSISTHQPYREFIDSSFKITDSTLPDSYKYYLNACHFADKQIGMYIDYLKEEGLYNNSFIIIASDHDAHLSNLHMENRISNRMPLFLLNVPDSIKEKMWHGECNQIDVYTTLLDLLGIESDWYGLGQSLLSPDYSNDIGERKWDVSEWIIRGNYFSK